MADQGGGLPGIPRGAGDHCTIEKCGGYRPGYVFQVAWTEKRRPALFARRWAKRLPDEQPIALLADGASVTVVANEDGAVLCTTSSSGKWLTGYLCSVEREVKS